MDAVAARLVLEPFVASQKVPPLWRPAAGMKRIARKLRLVPAARLVPISAESSRAALHRIALLGTAIADQPDEIAVIVPGGWKRMNRVVLTANPTVRRDAIDLWAAALEGWVSQRTATKVLDLVEIKLADLSA